MTYYLPADWKMLYPSLLFTYDFSLFCYTEKFLMVLSFINSLFKRKSVHKLAQVSIKISKISYFSFSFKVNRKEKSAIKKLWFGEGDSNEKFFRTHKDMHYLSL